MNGQIREYFGYLDKRNNIARRRIITGLLNQYDMDESTGRLDRIGYTMTIRVAWEQWLPAFWHLWHLPILITTDIPTLASILQSLDY